VAAITMSGSAIRHQQEWHSSCHSRLGNMCELAAQHLKSAQPRYAPALFGEHLFGGSHCQRMHASPALHAPVVGVPQAPLAPHSAEGAAPFADTPYVHVAVHVPPSAEVAPQLHVASATASGLFVHVWACAPVVAGDTAIGLQSSRQEKTKF
jgi:hypothetical protein